MQILNITCLAVILTSSAHNQIIAVNEKFLTTFGYTRKEVIGKTPDQLNIWVSSREREALTDIVRKEGRAENFPAKLRTKTGQIIACCGFVEYSLFDGKECIVSLIYDAPETLRQSEIRYHDMIRDVPIIIMCLAETGRILFINEFGAKYFGYQPPELTDQMLRDTLLPEFESTGRNLWHYYQNLLKNPVNDQQLTCEIVKRDGRRVWIEWINRIQTDALSGQANIVTVGIDITARRRAEALVKTLYERRRCDKILSDVIENRISEAAFFGLLAEIGCPLTPPLLCCLVVLDDDDERLKCVRQDREEWQAWVDTAINLIASRLGGLAWDTEHGLVIVHHSLKKPRGRAHDDAAWVESIISVIQDVFRGIRYLIGVSTIHPEIKTVYKQSYEAAKIGPVFHPGKTIYYWRDLGVNRLLIEQAKSDAGLAFIQDYLGPLLEKRSSRNAEWLITLGELISGDSMIAMAARLHIHPKTLAFRKIRIKRLLQLEIDDPEERLNIAIALKLKQLREKL